MVEYRLNWASSKSNTGSQAADYKGITHISNGIKANAALVAGREGAPLLRIDFKASNDSAFAGGVQSLGLMVSGANAMLQAPDIRAYDLEGRAIDPSGVAIESTQAGTLRKSSISIKDFVSRIEIDAQKSPADSALEISNIVFESIPVRATGFASGTRILTEFGAVAIEDICIGDLVVTLGHGLLPIRWIGEHTVSATGHLAPVCIRNGTLGNNRDLLVSPNHLMMVSSARVSALFSEDEVFVPVNALLDGAQISQSPGGNVTYMHVLFDHHVVIYAEGAATESLMLNEYALAGFPQNARAEVLSTFPELRGKVPQSLEPARPVLTMAEAQLLLR